MVFETALKADPKVSPMPRQAQMPGAGLPQTSAPLAKEARNAPQVSLVLEGPIPSLGRGQVGSGVEGEAAGESPTTRLGDTPPDMPPLAPSLSSDTLDAAATVPIGNGGQERLLPAAATPKSSSPVACRSRSEGGASPKPESLLTASWQRSSSDGYASFTEMVHPDLTRFLYEDDTVCSLPTAGLPASVYGEGKESNECHSLANMLAPTSRCAESSSSPAAPRLQPTLSLSPKVESTACRAASPSLASSGTKSSAHAGSGQRVRRTAQVAIVVPGRGVASPKAEDQECGPMSTPAGSKPTKKPGWRYASRLNLPPPSPGSVSRSGVPPSPNLTKARHKSSSPRSGLPSLQQQPLPSCSSTFDPSNPKELGEARAPAKADAPSQPARWRSASALFMAPVWNDSMARPHRRSKSAVLGTLKIGDFIPDTGTGGITSSQPEARSPCAGWESNTIASPREASSSRTRGWRMGDISPRGGMAMVSSFQIRGNRAASKAHPSLPWIRPSISGHEGSTSAWKEGEGGQALGSPGGAVKPGGRGQEIEAEDQSGWNGSVGPMIQRTISCSPYTRPQLRDQTSQAPNGVKGESQAGNRRKAAAQPCKEATAGTRAMVRKGSWEERRHHRLRGWTPKSESLLLCSPDVDATSHEVQSCTGNAGPSELRTSSLADVRTEDDPQSPTGVPSKGASRRHSLSRLEGVKAGGQALVHRHTSALQQELALLSMSSPAEGEEGPEVEGAKACNRCEVDQDFAFEFDLDKIRARVVSATRSSREESDDVGGGTAQWRDAAGDFRSMPHTPADVSTWMHSQPLGEERTSKVWNCRSRSISTEVLQANGGEGREIAADDIRAATNNFSDANLIGRGGSGLVYQGRLHGCHVAVKRFDAQGSRAGASTQRCRTGADEFLVEARVLTRMRHPHLVLLIGQCTEEKALVFEYLAGGNLRERLQTSSGCKQALSWRDRFHVAADISAALLFLHSHFPPILHGDVKPDNVLLDSGGKAKLGDVGLARLVPEGEESVSFRVKGTIGYMDPESFSTGDQTLSSDVYALGLVLIQLFTGIADIKDVHRQLALLGNHFPRNVDLAVESFSLLLDKATGAFPDHLARRALAVALQCVEKRAHHRPSLGELVQPELDSIAQAADQLRA